MVVHAESLERGALKVPGRPAGQLLRHYIFRALWGKLPNLVLSPPPSAQAEGLQNCKSTEAATEKLLIWGCKVPGMVNPSLLLGTLNLPVQNSLHFFNSSPVGDT